MNLLVKVKKGYYLYAIFAENERQDFGPIGIGEQHDHVYTLHHKDLAIAVSKAPLQQYDPVRKNAMAHQKVISTIMQRYDVLPISFGTCVDNRDEVMRLFDMIYEHALSALARIENKIEIGFKVSWKKDVFARELGAANPEVEMLKNKIANQGSKGHNYRHILEIGERLMQIADEKRRQYVKTLYEPLRGLAAGALLNEPTTERMIINATFLVDKANEEAFDRAVNELHNRHVDSLDFKYTGPWPPYSFVNIKIPNEG